MGRVMILLLSAMMTLAAPVRAAQEPAAADAGCERVGAETIDGPRGRGSVYIMLLSCRTPARHVVVLGRGEAPDDAPPAATRVLDRKTVNLLAGETVQLARGSCLIGRAVVPGVLVVKGNWQRRSRIAPGAGLSLVLVPSRDRTRLVPLVARALRCEADEP